MGTGKTTAGSGAIPDPAALLAAPRPFGSASSGSPATPAPRGEPRVSPSGRNDVRCSSSAVRKTLSTGKADENSTLSPIKTERETGRKGDKKKEAAFRLPPSLGRPKNPQGGAVPVNLAKIGCEVSYTAVAPRFAPSMKVDEFFSANPGFRTSRCPYLKKIKRVRASVHAPPEVRRVYRGGRKVSSLPPLGQATEVAARNP